MEAIKLTYVINAFFVMGLTIFSSVFNIRDVSRKKCKDRKTMRNYMYLALSVMVWTFASNILFYFRERIGMEFYTFGNWDRLPYMTIGSAVMLAVFIFFTALNIDLTRNDTNRYLSICKNLNVSGLAKSGISKKSKASKVKDIFSYKARLDDMHVKWSVEEKPKMTRNDVDEWNALTAYHNSVDSDINNIITSFGDKQSTFKNELAFISDSVYKSKAKNWLKDMNTYPDDETAFVETALLTSMYKSAGCQELRFYDFVKDKTDITQLTTAKLSELRGEFKTQESELYSDSLKKDVDDTFLARFKGFVDTLSGVSTGGAAAGAAAGVAGGAAGGAGGADGVVIAAAAGAAAGGAGGADGVVIADGVSEFTGKYIGNEFLMPGDKTCASVNNAETPDKIHKHTLHIQQIKTMVKDISSKYDVLKLVFNGVNMQAYEASVAIQDDYLRRRIISGFVWCMVLWPSLQSHDFVAKLYTAFGTERNQYAFYVGGVLMPVLVGVGLFGGKDVRTQLNLKNMAAIIKEIQNAKL